jgi:hypothetical protein
LLDLADKCAKAKFLALLNFQKVGLVIDALAE